MPWTPSLKKPNVKAHEIVLANNTSFEGSSESHALESSGLPVKVVQDASTGSSILSLIKSLIGHTLTLRTITGATLVGPNNNEINVFPVGGIIMWSGTLANVPAGWALCDGSNGTPDLRDKFILGWHDGVNPGGTGGATQHKHSVGTLANGAASAGTPAGTINVTKTTAAVQSGTGTTVLTDVSATFVGTALANHNHTITGKTDNAENGSASTASEDVYPPFYKLAFLMKTA